MKRLLFALFTLLLLFGGCEKKSVGGVHKVHFDRDMCTRCAMVVSDRHHAVQVIEPKRDKAYMFDDIGCMVLWFADEHVPWRDSAIIWITDAKSGEWIDAKTAFYDSGNVTPMAFGYMAHKNREDIEKGKEVFTYDEVVKRISEK